MVYGTPPTRTPRTPLGDYLPTHLEPAALTATYATKAEASRAAVVSTASMDRWLSKVAAVRAGTGTAKLLLLGDSTTAGIAAGTDTIATSYPTALRRRLALNLPVVEGASIIDYFPAMDTRWTLNAGWAYSGEVGPGGASAKGAVGAAGFLLFKPGYAFDTIDVWLLHGPGYGTVNVGVGGGTALTVDCSVGTGWQLATTTYGAPLDADASITISGPTGGDVHVGPIEARTAGAANVRVSNWGVPGSSAVSWSNAWGGSNSLNAITAYAPDLTVIMLGINDAGSPVSDANYKTYLGQVIDAAAASGDVILCSVVQSSPANQSGAQLAAEAGYVTQQKALAAERNLPFIDVFNIFGPYSATDGRWYDTLHPTPKGYAELGRIILAGILAA